MINIVFKKKKNCYSSFSFAHCDLVENYHVTAGNQIVYWKQLDSSNPDCIKARTSRPLCFCGGFRIRQSGTLGFTEYVYNDVIGGRLSSLLVVRIPYITFSTLC